MAATSKRFKAERIVNPLREIDIMTANGKTRSLQAGWDERQELLPLAQDMRRTQSRSSTEIQRSGSRERQP